MTLASAYDAAGSLEQAVDAYKETIRWGRVGRTLTTVTGMTFRMLGVLRLLGRLREADEVCRETFAWVQEQGMADLPASGILHIAMGEIALERNDLAAAEAHLARGIELGRWSGRLDAIPNVAGPLARLRQARGDPQGAMAAVHEAQGAFGDAAPPLARAGFLALQGEVLIRQGVLGQATQCIEEAARLAAADQGQSGEHVRVAQARLWLAVSEPREAAAQLTRSLATADEKGRRGVALELLILRCLALAKQGDMTGAESDLERALTIAEPEGYVRLFVDEGEPMAVLLRRLARAQRQREGKGYSPGYLATLLAALEAEGAGRSPGDAAQPGGALVERTPSPGAAPGLIEPLSERELEVLQLMADGLTNKQIAAALIIALGTVKAHIHNISGKLGAQNRAHAVARARELGLL